VRHSRGPGWFRATEVIGHGASGDRVLMVYVAAESVEAAGIGTPRADFAVTGLSFAVVRNGERARRGGRVPSDFRQRP
jgi:hypothetical protein